MTPISMLVIAGPTFCPTRHSLKASSRSALIRANSSDLKKMHGWTSNWCSFLMLASDNSSFRSFDVTLSSAPRRQFGKLVSRRCEFALLSLAISSVPSEPLASQKCAAIVGIAGHQRKTGVPSLAAFVERHTFRTPPLGAESLDFLVNLVKNHIHRNDKLHLQDPTWAPHSPWFPATRGSRPSYDFGPTSG